eukprot:TRINITY_DN1475_c0_g1_i10.p2 TRINITY_DN1475_c0_g1~~TRINITY_DN1475_c0_g1_i10.p2  ORF type:complete len:305 (-),score=133.14 TRINITY_DN1475_c0_g1_i10:102-1016(-)
MCIRDRYNEKYEYQRDIADPRFGRTYLLKQRENGQNVLLKRRRLTPMENDAGINERGQFNHPYLVRNLIVQPDPVSIPQNERNVNIIFEWFPWDLDREISRRAQTQNYFTEQELNYVFRVVAGACHYLFERQAAHGDIEPNQVLFDRDGKAKVVDVRFVTAGEGVAAESSRQKKLYPSPQELNRQGYDIFKGDVWGLGCTLLHASLLQNVGSIYVPSGVSAEKINELIIQASSRYSQDFILLLRDLLEIDQARRPDWRSLQPRADKTVPPAAAQPFQAQPNKFCLLYTSPSPRDGLLSRMPSSA